MPAGNPQASIHGNGCRRSQRRLLLGLVVVLVLINLPTSLILLMLDLFVLLRRQLAAIGTTIGGHLMIDVRFAVFQVRGLARRQLSRTNSLCYTSLLIEAAPVDGIHGCRPRRPVVRGCPLTAVLASRVLVGELV